MVLTTIPYNDSTQFVHIYTEAFGKITCRLSVGRRKKGAAQRSLYAPFSVLDIVIDRQNSHGIASIIEASPVLSSYMLSATDPAKAAQCMYMAELLDKTIGEVENNPKLWQFVSHSAELLQLTTEGAANFHLVFTTRLCYYLGFHVDNSAYRKGMQFDISEGVFTAEPIYHPYYLTAESAGWLHLLLDTKFSTLPSLRLTRKQRDTLLDMMLTFLRIHMPEAGELRCVDVLKDLFV
ncbi:MAG: DNA repair protein RecO [Bacteroidales bacterium]|nr:DNA repair protein RecO [Candidatus Liminaster caballi]